MKLLLSFEDSEIDRVEQSGDTLVIFIAAAFVKRIADAASPEQDGFARKVRLTLHGVRHTVAASELIGRIAQGRVRIGDQWLSWIPLPSEHPGPVAIELRLSNRSSLDLSADALVCTFSGEPNFSESLFC